MRNTGVFVLFQVSLMVAVSLVTSLILNRNIAGRGFFRAVFFFPFLLSPVVVGLIWRWILQREGLLNLFMVNLGLEPKVWLADRFYAFAAAVGVSTWAYKGFYTMILQERLEALLAQLLPMPDPVPEPQSVPPLVQALAVAFGAAGFTSREAWHRAMSDPALWQALQETGIMGTHHLGRWLGSHRSVGIERSTAERDGCLWHCDLRSVSAREIGRE